MLIMLVTGNVTTKRSTSGSAFRVGKGLVKWSSQTQTSVSFSTIELECIELSQAVQELTWLMLLMSDLLDNTDVKPIYICRKPECYMSCEKHKIS